jgi:microcystin-dependent protein
MVADTYSTKIGIILQGTGNNNNSWGDNLNAGLQVADDGIAGKLSSAVTGGTLDLSGTPPPAAPSQARYAVLKFSGVLVSDQTVIVPNLDKRWHIVNGTSGAFALFFKTTSGSSIDVPQGTFKDIICDGGNTVYRTDIYDIGEIKYIARASVPPGFQECDGTLLNRTRNVSLFTAVGTTWGAGDGSTTFGTPNLKDTGRFLRSRTNSVTLGTYQTNQYAAHTHTGTASGTTATEGATHTHSGTTSAGSAHSHPIQGNVQQGNLGAGGNAFVAGTSPSSGTFATGRPDSVGSTETESAHTHTYTSGTESATHTHTFTSNLFTTSSSGTGSETRPEAAVMIACIRL